MNRADIDYGMNSRGRSIPNFPDTHFCLILFAAAVPVLGRSGKLFVLPGMENPSRLTEAPYACPALAHIAPDLVTDGFYRLDDPTHSIIDPVRQEAYRKSSDAVKAVGMAIVKAADDYRTTGSRAAANVR